MKVIMFNGSPRSGKDTAVGVAQDGSLNETSVHIKMAEPLYNGIQELFGLTRSEWWFMYNEYKETSFLALNNMTPREAMIWLSEEVFKPKFGSRFFGGVAAKKMTTFFEKEPDGIVLMSDAGFNDEVSTVVDIVGKENCFLVRLYGHTGFEGDSREHVDPFKVGILPPNFFEIYNTGSIYEFKENVKLVVQLIERK